jgi:hypothetical protein
MYRLLRSRLLLLWLLLACLLFQLQLLLRYLLLSPLPLHLLQLQSLRLRQLPSFNLVEVERPSAREVLEQADAWFAANQQQAQGAMDVGQSWLDLPDNTGFEVGDVLVARL